MPDCIAMSREGKVQEEASYVVFPAHPMLHVLSAPLTAPSTRVFPQSTLLMSVRADTEAIVPDKGGRRRTAFIYGKATANMKCYHMDAR